jgi:hypothetical protein
VCLDDSPLLIVLLLFCLLFLLLFLFFFLRLLLHLLHSSHPRYASALKERLQVRYSHLTLVLCGTRCNTSATTSATSAATA